MKLLVLSALLVCVSCFAVEKSSFKECLKKLHVPRRNEGCEIHTEFIKGIVKCGSVSDVDVFMPTTLSHTMHRLALLEADVERLVKCEEVSFEQLNCWRRFLLEADVVENEAKKVIDDKTTSVDFNYKSFLCHTADMLKEKMPKCEMPSVMRTYVFDDLFFRLAELLKLTETVPPSTCKSVEDIANYLTHSSAPEISY